jgi:ABC-type phosphate transport system auxiliary subunit
MKTIRIYARKKTITMKSDKTTKDIMEYSYTKDGEKFFQVKFKLECEKQPKQSGYYLLDVNENDLSIQHSKPQEKFTPNDVLWIGNVVDFRQDIEYEKELESKRLKEIKALFD